MHAPVPRAGRQDANDPPRAGSFDYTALLCGHQAVLVKGPVGVVEGRRVSALSSRKVKRRQTRRRIGLPTDYNRLVL